MDIDMEMECEYDPAVSIARNGVHYRTDKYRSFTVTCYLQRVLTTVTARPSVVRTWLYNIRRTHYHHIRRGQLVVGLGVQWRSNPVRSELDRPATIQLCVGSRCLIFQLLFSNSSPRSLHRFLSNPSISFVGVWNHNDNNMLRRSPHNLSVSRLIELRHVAHEYRGTPKTVSMERLAMHILGMDEITKPVEVGNSNWDLFLLNDGQVEYACIDAYVSFVMGKQLQVWNWDNSYRANGYVSD